ncbi:MAG: hypothetical protein ACU0CY_13900 [Maritimibacter harenae]
MTPPDTDMQKDKRRHRGPVIVVILLIAVVLLGFVVWMGGVFETAPGRTIRKARSRTKPVRSNSAKATSRCPRARRPKRSSPAIRTPT